MILIELWVKEPSRNPLVVDRIFAKEMTGWIKAGKIKCRKQMVEGLESAPEAFNGMLKGKNFGKVVIKVGAA